MPCGVDAQLRPSGLLQLCNGWSLQSFTSSQGRTNLQNAKVLVPFNSTARGSALGAHRSGVGSKAGQGTLERLQGVGRQLDGSSPVMCRKQL